MFLVGILNMSFAPATGLREVFTSLFMPLADIFRPDVYCGFGGDDGDVFDQNPI
jgi:hypothetical protein